MGADLAEEEQFGPYLVYERLGVGGMATVHRALERGIEGFERIVALKRLLPHLAEDASFIKSFVREAKLASLLNHVNIVQIFELGRVGTEYFISMEYIDGRDIRRILRHARKVTGPPPVHVTVGLLLQLCEALDYAHAKVDEQGHPLRLVHRDISPSNLLVTSIGHLKIIDFGIAKAQSTHLRTQTGRVKGKLAYMAPEAIAGKDLDARSDLFAVGVIAHELLTARPLFASKNEYQTLLKVQRGDVHTPSTFNQGCPAEMDAIVLKALAREPEQRYAGAAEMRDELLALRRKYNLQTGHRDVAQWLDWAFKLETPSHGFGPTTTNVTSDPAAPPSLRHITPKPAPRREDEEAVEVAWGNGEVDEAGAEPVVLDDVPDVSDKHLGVRVDLSDIDSDDSALDHDHDDIPAPQPSHGHSAPMRAPTRTGDAAVASPLGAVKPDREGSAPSLPPPPPSGRGASSSGVPEVAGSSTRLPQASTRGSGPNPVVPQPARGSGPAIQTQRELSISIHTPPGSGPQRTTAQGLRAPSGSVLPEDGPRDRPATGSLSGGRRSAPPGTPDPDQTGNVDLPPPRPARALSEIADEDLSQRARRATKPGMAAPRAPTSTPPLDDDMLSTQPRPKRPSAITIGASIVERQSVRRRGWVWIAALIVAGLAAAGVAIYMSRDKATEPAPAPEPIAKDTTPPAPAPTSTIKFLTEPADAEISIEGKDSHKGSPWTIDLPPGTYTVNIQRDGYKARLMSIEVSAKDKDYIIPLEKLAVGAAAADATLILSSSPGDLEAWLDGKKLGDRTPLRTEIKPGPHTIVLRQNGAEVWRQYINAQANRDYMFNPAILDEKQRAEKREREKRAAAAAEQKRLAEAKATSDPTVTNTDAKTDATTEKPTKPPQVEAGTTKTPPAIKEKDPAPTPPIAKKEEPGPQVKQDTPPAPVTPTARPGATGPVILTPNLIPTRTAGDTPNVAKSKRAEMPSMVAAKVCIDTNGKVTSVSVINAQKLERMTVGDLTSALYSWKYAPYKQNGVAVPACFVVNFQVK